MKRFFSFLSLKLTAFFALIYTLVAWRLELGLIAESLLAIPFILVWLLPVLYWSGDRNKDRPVDHFIHIAGYLSMAWLSFFLFFLISIEVVYYAFKWTAFTQLSHWIKLNRGEIICAFSVFAMLAGNLRARSGPLVKKINIALDQTPDPFKGFKIVHITDLHVGPTIRKDYVEKVVKKSKVLNPDLVVLTGDIVDGPLYKYLDDLKPIEEISENAFLALGNHDYYSGINEWVPEFERLGIKVLVNEHILIERNGTKLLLAGVTDPAAKIFDPQNQPNPMRALTNGFIGDSDKPMLKVLLAHNPKLAREAAAAGFHLQLSGHTHAGQFLPWTMVVKKVHYPHYWGLSKEGDMSVFVGAGTGSWGPPIRFGTRPELVLITLT